MIGEIVVKKNNRQGRFITYWLYLNNVNIGRLFRTGFGGDLEWTLVDIYFDKTTGFKTKRDALEEMDWLYVRGNGWLKTLSEADLFRLMDDMKKELNNRR